MREAGGATDVGAGSSMGPVTIQSVAPTVCALMGIAPPEACEVPALDAVLTAAENAIGAGSSSDRAGGGAGTVHRCLIYAPDAMGEHLLAVDPSFYEATLRVAPVRVRLRSVLPPKTPVCFASMFTGAGPATHGIRRYERPVVRTDTLFDALIRAGRKVAIVAVTGCSIDLIFRERAIDFFSEKDDVDVTARAVALIEEDRHDLVLAYHQEYDDRLHETEPFAPRAFLAARAHIGAFATLSEAIDRHWAVHPRAILFTPDHGAHRDPASGRGDHGEDSAEDMNVSHFYGIRAGGPRSNP
jgi:hypothetical protein